MSHFSYSCKTERENGISHLNSALCINCKFTSECNSGIFQNYLLPNHLDVHLVQTTSETSIWPFCFHLNSQVSFKLQGYLSYKSWIFQKDFRMLNTQESGCASGMDHFRTWNEVWKIKNWNFFLPILWSSIGQTGLNFEFIQPSKHSKPHTSFCH